MATVGKVGAASGLRRDGRAHTGPYDGEKATETPFPFKDVCGKCGARRVDRQIGLEATPDLFVAAMVAVFREVRRVLAPHGTCWVNLGDSYATDGPGAAYDWTNGKTSKRDEGTMGAYAHKPTGLPAKNLVGVPWRVAFALQQDGWWLRSDIIWAKPNPMPESVTDRPTKAHEYVFLLTKRPRYWFDAEAVREPQSPAALEKYGSWERHGRQSKSEDERVKEWEPRQTVLPNGRNVRSVWEIATQPYPEAHFATFPEELPRRAIAAGCPLEVCRVCGKPRERIVDVSPMEIARSERTHPKGHTRSSGTVTKPREAQTVGWSDCGHNNYRSGLVLDPFAGAGTTLLVARKLGRASVGIELSESYCRLIEDRCAQLSLLSELAT